MTMIDPASINPRPAPRDPLRAQSPLPPHQEFRNVLWAVDIGHADDESADTAACALAALAPDANVLPVHVLDPEGLNWNGETPADRTEQLRPAAQAALERTLERAGARSGLRSLAHPMIVETKDVPFSGIEKHLVRKLLSRARRFHTDLIVVSHHGRGGFARWLHPSFTETLLEEGNIPLLVLNPHCAIATHFETLIFPTDFSPSCHRSFERALILARSLNARIRLYYKVTNVVGPVVQSGVLLLGGGWISLDGMTTPVNDHHIVQGRLWVEQAEREGVEVEFEAEDSGLGVAPMIASFCSTSRNPLLIMSAPEGHLGSGLWGSITRDIMKLSGCPCLVLRG